MASSMNPGNEVATLAQSRMRTAPARLRGDREAHRDAVVAAAVDFAALQAAALDDAPSGVSSIVAPEGAQAGRHRPRCGRIP